MIIDAYSHIAPVELVEALSKQKEEEDRMSAARVRRWAEEAPQFCDPSARIKHMDKHHIDMQVMTLTPHSFLNYKKDPENMIRLAQITNDSMAAIQDKYKGRLITTGIVPLLALNDGGLEEMDRAINTLGLKGFVIDSHISDKPLDSPEFFPFFERATQYDIPIYIHPSNPISFEGRKYEKDYDLCHVFGWPFETTLALARLVFSGILERLPNLKIVSHHLGAMLSFFAERVKRAYDEKTLKRLGVAKLSRPLFDYFKMIYHDTAIDASVPALTCATMVFDPDRIIFATDYPYGPKGGEERLEKFPGSIEALNISREAKTKIFEGNARRLLGLK